MATCSHTLLGWSGRGCHTRASTSCRRQRQGISEGLTSTVNRYWWLLRFTWRDAHRRDGFRCELKFTILSVILFGSCKLVDKASVPEPQAQWFDSSTSHCTLNPWCIECSCMSSRISRWELIKYQLLLFTLQIYIFIGILTIHHFVHLMMLQVKQLNFTVH